MVLALQEGALEEVLTLDGHFCCLEPASEGWFVVKPPLWGINEDLLVSRVRSKSIEWTRKLPWRERGDDFETLLSMGDTAVLSGKLAVVTSTRGPGGDRMAVHTLTPDGLPGKRYVALRSRAVKAIALAPTPSGGLYIAGQLAGAAAFGNSAVNTLAPVDRNQEGFVLFIEKP